MPYLDNKDDQMFVLNSTKNSEISDTISPKIPEPRPLQCLAKLARMVKQRHTAKKKISNAPYISSTDLAQTVFGVTGDINRPCQVLP